MSLCSPESLGDRGAIQAACLAQGAPRTISMDSMDSIEDFRLETETAAKNTKELRVPSLPAWTTRLDNKAGRRGWWTRLVHEASFGLSGRMAPSADGDGLRNVKQSNKHASSER